MKRDIQYRTKQFALRIIRLVEGLPKNKVTDVIGRQLLKSGTSVGANYRAACRAKSKADFIYKLGIVEEEADESLFWLEILVEAKIVAQNRIEDLMEEANEIVAIIIASIKTARKNKEK